MDLVVRTGDDADVDAVLAVWRAADAAPSVTDDADSVRALLQRDPGALLVAEHVGRIVGTLIAGFDGWRAAMYRLAVVPDARRGGVALALVDEGERRLQALGARRIGAIVLHDHDDAVWFWRVAGYHLDGAVGRYVKNL